MKTFQGEVVSTKMKKVAAVWVERSYRHPMYGKILKKGKKIHAVNGLGAKLKDRVLIAEIRPVAKTVHFMIKEIISGQKKVEGKTAVEQKLKEKIKEKINKSKQVKETK